MNREHTAYEELVGVAVPAVFGIVICDPDFEGHTRSMTYEYGPIAPAG